ncbi:MAG TPA: phosphoglycerate mutase family protein [Baekduia sp.]|nr:phosphoglycerate mutase family protein [Baekduia sp.]
MATQLWLLRHGEAEPHDARPDPERRLTERGEQQARSAGAAMAALKLTFQAVYASPRVRAWDTAALACEALGLDPVEHGPLAGGFDLGEARELLLAHEPDARILVVGHNPDLAQIVHDATGARIELDKGGLAGVRLTGARGELVALLRPRELDRIGGPGR